MHSATVTSKGQITIPAQVRALLGLDTGDRVHFVETSPGRLEIIAANKSVKSLKGMFGKPAKPLSVDEMNRIITMRAGKTK